LTSGSLQFDVTIVIVSFNTRDVLRECLQSVYREAGSLRVQVIVVDNASTDGTAAMIEREFSGVLLIRSEVNLGFGPANNLGFQAAGGRYIVLLNSDAFLSEGSLQLSVAHMDATTRAGLGGGRLIGRDGSWQPSARMFPTVFNDLLVLSGLAARFPHSGFFGRADRTWASPMEAAEVDWVPGAYSIVRAEVLRSVGSFDLCKRIKNAGHSIWYWPDIAIVHIGGESSRQVRSLQLSRTGAQLTLWRMRSMLLYYRKHHGLSAWLAVGLEALWYWLRSQRRRWSKDADRRASASDDLHLISILSQAWRDTAGGRFSPAQPW
jgi:hypothetical protein